MHKAKLLNGLLNLTKPNSKQIMFELLAFAMIVGQVEIAPGVIQTEYLQNSSEIVTVITQPNDEHPCH
jgi:hypothetical protein